MEQVSRSREHQHFEWKESWRDEYQKWICGFANADGGILEIGRDDSGRVVGVKDAARLLADIPNKVPGGPYTGAGTALRAYRLVGGISVSARTHAIPHPENHRGSYRGSYRGSRAARTSG